MRTLSIAGCCFLAYPQSDAGVSVPSVIGDNMVLQRGVKVPIWGTADAGEKVTVNLGNQCVTATADENGKWMVCLAPLDAGGPHEMTIEGKNTITLRNILVGEVWVCSGQSNMEWPLNAALNAPDEVAAADHPEIRLCHVQRTAADRPLDDVQAGWAPCTPETAHGFSAVGYFFGRHLHRELGVPIGLIDSSWGGTCAEWWTSRPALAAEPELSSILEDWRRAWADYEQKMGQYQVFAKEWDEKIGRTADREKPKPPTPPDAHRRPSALYNGMIAPLIPYAIKGVTWYQGESNAGRASQYRKLFPTMIRDWRTNWGQGEFPFLFVQLANYAQRSPEPAESAWAELREAQLMALSLSNTAMAVIIDVGEADDIHPRNKQDVGKRLALTALGTAYGRDVVYSGPMYESMQIEGRKIRLHFNHVDGGLVAKGGKLEGFAIAGEDRKFVWGEAEIDGETVLVQSDEVEKPVTVRYAWADNPVATLYNEAGLPASPFRTDDLSAVTSENG